MTAKISPIDKNKHAKFKVKGNDLSNTAAQHLCPALAQEFPQLAAEFPIVFVKDDTSGHFHSVAMLGLKPGENLYLQGNKWQANYIPTALRTYPFSLTKADAKGERLAVCIDEGSALVNAEGTEGNALFNHDGSESEYLKNIGSFLTTVMSQGRFTDDFSKYLGELGLFEAQTITVKLDDGSDHSLTGVFRIDEVKLNALSNDDFIKLRELSYLPAIYAHLASLRQVNNLGRLNALRGKASQPEANAATEAKGQAH